MNRDRWNADHFIFSEYATSNQALGIYRILVAGCILWVFLPEFLWISDFPNSAKAFTRRR